MKIKIGKYEIEGTPSEMAELVSSLQESPKRRPLIVKKKTTAKPEVKAVQRCTARTRNDSITKGKRCMKMTSRSYVCSKTGFEIMTPGGKYCFMHHPEYKKHEKIVKDAGLKRVPHYNPNIHSVVQLREREKVLKENRAKYVKTARS